MEMPLSADHFGHIGVNSCIRLGKGLTKFNVAWLEDIIPWQYTEQLKKISDAVDIPRSRGEDIYLKEGFIELAKNHAVDILHPDLATSGGILKTKKIGDTIQEYGVPMAMPFAAVQCLAWLTFTARRQLRIFSCWKIIPWTFPGFITVPNTPGLGITLNDEVMKQHLLPNSGGSDLLMSTGNFGWVGENGMTRLRILAKRATVR